MGNDLVERLRSAMCPGSERCNVLTCYPDCECGAMEAAAARIEALEEALKPFSEAAKLYNHPYSQPDAPDYEAIIQWANIVEKITVGDLRRAARAYANKGEPT